ncbi:MAG: hypothetical protein E7276_04765 [Pseudobutyrivibrio sp.]|nr:hypothetical protein [Pseudobutyrivibrio sp.]
MPVERVWAAEDSGQTVTQETQQTEQQETQPAEQQETQQTDQPADQSSDDITDEENGGVASDGENGGEDSGEADGENAEENAEEGVIEATDWDRPTITGTSDPTLPALSVEEMIAGTQSNPAEDNLYVLTVATGIKPGDTVHYFAVRYTDGNGANRTKYIFPHEDAFKVSYDYMNAKGGENATVNKRHEILGQLGYKVNGPTEPSPLQAWSVDEYLFKADHGLTGITSVEVFMTKGAWTVQGMTVSKVTSIAGYGEYGYYSGKYFFGLGKEKIAVFDKKQDKVITISVPVDNLINLAGSTSELFGIKSPEDDKEETDTPFDDLFSIRMDFADTLDGGLESYLKTSANDLNIASADIVEDIAVEIEYKDKNSWTRKVAMPVILSAAGQYVESGDDVKTYGLCQRGDTIAFTGCLPELSTVVSTKVYVGSAARTLLANEGGFDFASDEARNNKAGMVEALDSDNISLGGVSIYEGTCRISNINDGADSVTGETVTAVSTAYSFLSPTPFAYFTTSNESGFAINAGGQEDIAIKKYESKDPLLAAENNKHFLIRLHTDSMEQAATKNDIYVQLTYSTNAAADRKSERFSAKTNVQNLLGYWPSTTDKKGDFAYNYEARADGTIEFPVELKDCTGITDIEISLGNGDDDWQLAGISVDYLPEIGARRVYLRTTTGQGESSAFQIVRTMDSGPIPPLPFKVIQLFGPNTDYHWNVNTGEGAAADELDYESMRYSMTYEQTQMNLGFINTAKRFDVTVEVANDSDTSNANGDSGSSNQFYFQLMFKNGDSSVVLANQQLSSDGFRAGYEENFTIAVNRDYGALTGVRIIPEDVSEDSEIFDKLNINKITVTEQSNGGASMQYIIDSVGWIGIDYHDKAEDNSIKGRRGRLMAEIARKYNVSYQRHVVNLLCEVTTRPWVAEDYIQVQASICCDLNYLDTDGRYQTISFDVVERMYEYMDKQPISYEAPTNPDDPSAKYYKNMTTVSDPEWMLRPNHIDRFVLPAIPNIQTLKSITFYATSRNNKPGQWVIGDVAISQILDDGPASLTADNEYYRDLSTEALCRMDSDKEVSMLLPAGSTQKQDIKFTDNQLVWNEDDSWVSPVTRMPDSTDDTLNIYLYPTAGNTAIDGEDVTYAVQYSIPFQNPQQQRGSFTTFASGTESACFIAQGVNAAGMGTLNNMTIQCMDSRMIFDHAIVQQIRENVVVSTYYIPYNGASAILGTTGTPNSLTTIDQPRLQKLYLSFGTDTVESTLFAEENDIAVSFKYRSSLDQSGQEYYSPYVYLTDTGIGKISPGLMAEIPFDVPYVSEVTGYRIVSFGGISATVEGAFITNSSYSSITTNETTGQTEVNDLTVLGSYSMADITDQSVIVPVQVGNTIVEKPVSGAGMVGDNTVNPLDLVFATTGAVATGESGTSAAVQMTFNYYDHTGAQRSRVLTDARTYIQGENKTFQTGNNAEIRLFLPECKELLSIDIQPYDDSGTANWSVDSISGNLGLGTTQINRMVNNTFVQGKTDSIYIKEVVMTTYYSINGNASQTVTNHQSSAALNSGEKISVSVVIADGTGFTAKAIWLVNGVETDVTSSTISNLSGTGFNLLVPKNTSTSPQTFQIVVASAANPSVKDVISIAVSPMNTGTANDIINQLQKNSESQSSTPSSEPNPTEDGGAASDGDQGDSSPEDGEPASGGGEGNSTPTDTGPTTDAGTTTNTPTGTGTDTTTGGGTTDTNPGTDTTNTNP